MTIFDRMKLAGPLWSAMRTRFQNLIALANNLQALAVGMNPHKTDDVTNVSTAANAYDLTSAGTLITALVTKYEAHRVSTTHHLAADSTNAVIDSTPAVSTLAECYTAINDLKAKMNAHIMESGVSHEIKDDSLVVAVADATSLSTLCALCNAVKVAYAAHLNRASRFTAVETIG